ncbi:tetratricopeptide repeat protein [Marinibaculum pumilum]|uniref:Tetratricopeptide repeat protein n=1 Tax=Marinibaculum pumilum TaxID=1766165 RepID=A0ABV7KXI2_9PROT
MTGPHGKPDGEAAEREQALREALDAADQHLRRGRLEEAGEVYRRVLELEPRNFEAMVGIGDLLLARGQPGDALMAYGNAQKQHPQGSARLFVNKGGALAAVQEVEAAVGSFRRAHALEPDNPDILCNLGSVLVEAGEPAAAIAVFRDVQELRPDAPQSHFGMALAIQAMSDAAWREAAPGSDRIEAAIAAYRAALDCDPAFAQAAVNLAQLLLARGEAEAALDLVERAELQVPRDLPLLMTKAQVHDALGSRGLAVVALENAVLAHPDSLDARAALAQAALSAGKRNRSMAASMEVLARDPEHRAAKFCLGLGLIEDGKFGKARELLGQIADLSDARRLLQFLDMTEGKTDAWALLAAEAGPGPAGAARWDGQAVPGTLTIDATGVDPQLVIALARLVPQAAARAGRLVLCCEPVFGPLLQSLDGVAELRFEAAAGAAEDARLALPALPSVLGLRGRALPGDIPYLVPAPGRDRPWPASLFVANEPVVIVCWREAGTAFGPDQDLPFRTLEPLFDGMPVRFLSLSYQTGANDAALMEDFGIGDLAGLCRDLDDVAAALSLADLVISADGLIPHLAGALGRECWAALPVLPGWLWGRRGLVAEAYPSVRTFRAARTGDWPAVVDDLRGELRARIG